MSVAATLSESSPTVSATHISKSAANQIGCTAAHPINREPTIQGNRDRDGRHGIRPFRSGLLRRRGEPRLYSARALAVARSLAFCNAVTSSSLLIFDRPGTPNRVANS